jgi:5-methyltetrahydrofolate--homocysteine methyltransferase
VEDFCSTVQDAVIVGDGEAVASLVDQALAAGVAPDRLLKEGLLPAMREVGRLMEAEEYYLPEVLLCVRTANVAFQKLRPLVVGERGAGVGTVVLGTVEGDIHDIGKNLVGMMLEGVGFTVSDVGINVPAGTFVDKVKELRPDVLAMSALLNNTVQRLPEVIQALREAGLREDVAVLVGGAAVTEEYARQIGADGYADDAGGAARVAEDLARRRTA